MLVPEYQVNEAVFQGEKDKFQKKKWQNLRTLSMLSYVYVNLSQDKLKFSESDEHVSLLKDTLAFSRTILGPFTSAMMSCAVSWLDVGIKKVLIQAESVKEEDLQEVATAASQLPPARVMVRLPIDLSLLVSRNDREMAVLNKEAVEILEAKLKKLKEVAFGIVLAIRSPTSHLGKPEYQKESDTLFKALTLIRETLDEGLFFAVEWLAAKQESFNRKVMLPLIAEFHKKGIHVLAPAVPELTEEQQHRFVDASQAFIQCIRSDRPDGLFTTVVTDESGIALGLVYSNEASILASIESGRGIYYSRSRKGLWKKGETSGNYQVLIQLDIDCDSDALRFMVRQHGGAFCHLNTRTCWGEAGGLTHLQAMLESRLQVAPEGSYTKRLFNDAELLRNKLVEEAQELAEAETPTHVAEEAADVLYFAMVRCVAAGVTLKDIEVSLCFLSIYHVC
jgi:phosphoribosyl-ATP pyrophosphohydrolase/phosphoribosyl-AMP cyclohydrolase/histidinol dehydrogenase